MSSHKINVVLSEGGVRSTQYHLDQCGPRHRSLEAYSREVRSSTNDTCASRICRHDLLCQPITKEAGPREPTHTTMKATHPTYDGGEGGETITDISAGSDFFQHPTPPPASLSLPQITRYQLDGNSSDCTSPLFTLLPLSNNALQNVDPGNEGGGGGGSAATLTSTIRRPKIVILAPLLMSDSKWGAGADGTLSDKTMGSSTHHHHLPTSSFLSGSSSTATRRSNEQACVECDTTSSTQQQMSGLVSHSQISSDLTTTTGSCGGYHSERTVVFGSASVDAVQLLSDHDEDDPNDPLSLKLLDHDERKSTFILATPIDASSIKSPGDVDCFPHTTQSCQQQWNSMTEHTHGEATKEKGCKEKTKRSNKTADGDINIDKLPNSCPRDDDHESFSLMSSCPWRSPHSSISLHHLPHYIHIPPHLQPTAMTTVDEWCSMDTGPKARLSSPVRGYYFGGWSSDHEEEEDEEVEQQIDHHTTNHEVDMRYMSLSLTSNFCEAFSSYSSSMHRDPYVGSHSGYYSGGMKRSNANGNGRMSVDACSGAPPPHAKTSSEDEFTTIHNHVLDDFGDDDNGRMMSLDDLVLNPTSPDHIAIHGGAPHLPTPIPITTVPPPLSTHDHLFYDADDTFCISASSDLSSLEPVSPRTPSTAINDDSCCGWLLPVMTPTTTQCTSLPQHRHQQREYISTTTTTTPQKNNKNEKIVAQEKSTDNPPRNVYVGQHTPRKMVLALSLDGSLIHSTVLDDKGVRIGGVIDRVQDAVLTVTYHKGAPTINDRSNAPTDTINIYYRPHLTYFITTLMKHFDIAIFSSSKQDYVDALLDVMDPTGQVFPKTRRYYRQHCTKVVCSTENGQRSALAKDLQILGRPLNEVVLVDDTAHSGALQPNNLLLIPTWTGDPSDTALLQLAEHLVHIAKSTNVSQRQ